MNRNTNTVLLIFAVAAAITIAYYYGREHNHPNAQNEVKFDDEPVTRSEGKILTDVLPVFTSQNQPIPNIPELIVPGLGDITKNLAPALAKNFSTLEELSIIEMSRRYHDDAVNKKNRTQFSRKIPYREISFQDALSQEERNWMLSRGYPTPSMIKSVFSSSNISETDYIDVATKAPLKDVGIKYLQLIKNSNVSAAEKVLNIASARGSTFAMIRMAAHRRKSEEKFAWLALAAENGDYAARRALKLSKIDLSALAPNTPDKSAGVLESITAVQRRLQEIRFAFGIPPAMQSVARPETLLDVRDEDFVEVYD
jgi:hypothetical protein